MARNPGEPESSGSGTTLRVGAFRLLYRGKEIPLESGEYVIGRAPGSDVLVDEPRVSRRHARLLVNDTTALLEDLQSENGVFVNEQRIRRSVRLSDGDRILVGTQEIVFVVGPADWDAARSSGTIEIAPPSSAPWRVTRKMAEGVPSTLEADAFQYLGDIAERMIRVGRGSTAERLLRGHLEEVMAAALATGRVSGDVIDAACVNALRLAIGIKKGEWIDFVIELLLILRTPPGPSITATLRPILPKLPTFDREKWRAYEQMLTSRMPSMTATEQGFARAFLWLEKP
jgi:pSer/pThr/pTyr-binding forkhead associated (FHA) protein